MGMLVSSARFGGFVNGRTRVYTSTQSIQVPAGAKSVRMAALGAGGGGLYVSQQSTYFGGGGGHMRYTALVPVVAGQTLTLSVGNDRDSTVAYGGYVILAAPQGVTPVRPPSGIISKARGGRFGRGGVGFRGGDATDNGNAAPQGGGGAAGTTGAGRDAYPGYSGERGSGVTFVDSDTGASYQNGSSALGSTGYGAGRVGTGYQQPRNYGFIVLEFSDVDPLTTTRVRDSNGDIVVPAGYTRAQLIVLAQGGYAGSSSYSDGENTYYSYTGGAGGCMMARNDFAVTPGQTLTYSADNDTLKLDGTTVCSSTSTVSRPSDNPGSPPEGPSYYGVGDQITFGGLGTTTEGARYYAGGAAGLYGDGGNGVSDTREGTAGSGPSFTDSISGLTVSPGQGGAYYYGGGQNYNGARGAGFCVVIFYSV